MRMITAHSGSDGYGDNSRRFVETMLDQVVDAFEVDCRLATDGLLYLWHDAVLNGWDYLSLAEVYQMMARHTNQKSLINVDCKTEDVGPLALALAHTYGVTDRVRLSGGLPLADFTPEQRGQLFYNLENKLDWQEWPIADDLLKRALAQIAHTGVKVVQSYYKLINAHYVDLIHQAGLALSVWTIDDLEVLTQYLAMGVDHITTNRALAYRQTLSTKGSCH